VGAAALTRAPAALSSTRTIDRVPRDREMGVAGVCGRFVTAFGATALPEPRAYTMVSAVAVGAGVLLRSMTGPRSC